MRFLTSFDLRVPIELITEVRRANDFHVSKPRLGVTDGTLAPLRETNVRVTLSAPVTVRRPYDGGGEVTVLDFYADDPGVAVTAIRAVLPVQS